MVLGPNGAGKSSLLGLLSGLSAPGQGQVTLDGRDLSGFSPSERTRAGLEVAKQLGRKGGRKPKMTDSKIESAKKLLASGVPPKDVAKNLGVSIPTLYRWVPASTHA